MNSKNPEGLRYPSIDDLLTHIDSKYKLAYAAAKRAKIIKKEGYSSMEELGGNKAAKPVGMALEEIEAGKIEIEFAPTVDVEEKRQLKEESNE
ncbi:MAG: DNA-directed RNA polymerase subunit omega [Gammaproteobacteria bacterium]|nr:DNA-directed RNA polymerase subunit omega [Gammaproteobacteria bacterium]